MRRKAPVVRQYMTHLPVEAEQFETVADAAQAMEKQGIHHMPIMSGARLKGVVSRSDIQAARVEHGKAAEDLSLEDICQQDVLTVSPLTPLDNVAREMLAKRVGSAVVVDGGFVVGIFTTTDALRFLCNWFGPDQTGHPTD